MSSRIASAACLVAAALTATGCGKHLSQTLGPPNQPPTVRLSSAPPTSAGALQVSHHLSWTGADPDGRVDHYLVATNPRHLDRVDDSWQAVRETERTLTLRRAQPGAQRLEEGGGAELEVFAVRAVDDRGALSEPAVRAMFGDNVAPSVQITAPRPSHLYASYVPPNFRVQWRGNDPDGPDPTRLAKYKFRLLRADEPLLEIALLDPDSLRRLYAPAFVGWDSVPGDSLGHNFTGLEISHDYLFVIVGFDVAGDYTPVFSLDTNMLLLHVFYPSVTGPRITMYGDYFNFKNRQGGISLDPSLEWPLEAPSDRALTVHWSADAIVGAFVAGFRWALDIADINDETPRHGPNDLEHWSAWNLATTSTTVGPFHGPTADQTHRLYIEARDSWGSVSLAVIRITPVRPTFESDLLIVDDTRLQPDQVVPTRPDSLAKPIGLWPTAAELDTFLYARGGVRWRMYPPGTSSRPGLFAGYHYDTLGTRTGRRDPTVPLSVLSRYRHVIWILDPKSALMDRDGTDPRSPVTALRYMSAPNRENTLVAYARAGGEVWLLGGGIAEGSYLELTRLQDLAGAHDVELKPGGMMYDIAHWRSRMSLPEARSLPRILRASPFTATSRMQPGDWGYGEVGATTRADYSLLPAELQIRDASSDPLPPLRFSSAFYLAMVPLEYLTAPNVITEERGEHRGTGDDDSTGQARTFTVLDSLYRADGTDLPRPPVVNACMTLYRGRENGRVIFSGFDLWTWRRSQCQQLVDGVLQGIWGLARDPVARVAAAPQPVATDRGGGR